MHMAPVLARMFALRKFRCPKSLLFSAAEPQTPSHRQAVIPSEKPACSLQHDRAIDIKRVSKMTLKSGDYVFGHLLTAPVSRQAVSGCSCSNGKGARQGEKWLYFASETQGFPMRGTLHGLRSGPIPRC